MTIYIIFCCFIWCELDLKIQERVTGAAVTLYNGHIDVFVDESTQD